MVRIRCFPTQQNINQHQNDPKSTIILFTKGRRWRKGEGSTDLRDGGVKCQRGKTHLVTDHSSDVCLVYPPASTAKSAEETAPTNTFIKKNLLY